MKLRYLFAFLLLAMIAGTSCGPTIEPPVDMGYNFIPIDTGRYYIYRVDSIRISCIDNVFDTVHYEMKETYPYTFLDGSNEIAVACIRYYRPDSTYSWSLLGDSVWTPNVWWIKRTTTRLEKSEENLKIVKMTYPIQTDYEWDGNAYNSNPAKTYYYGTPDVSFNNGFQTFGNTVTVYHEVDTSNLIQYTYETETYARDIGMVHKRWYSFTAITTSAPSGFVFCDAMLGGQQWYTVPILQRVKNGHLVNYTLIEYGFE